MIDAIRCSRCRQTLAPEAFAPSHRTQGAWCRTCRTAYAKQNYETRRTHGLNATYNAGCRCEPCLTAGSDWQRRRYDKQASKVRHCAECGAEFTRNHSNVTCSPECKRARLRRMKAERPRTRPHPGLAIALARRDGYDCGICHEPLDLEARWPHPLSLSVDHVIPTSKGGQDTADNQQLAHLRCNLKKHDALPTSPTQPDF